ncbi:MAG: hypothetical protein ABWK05_09330 [Pyrobaculum sp.]
MVMKSVALLKVGRDYGVAFLDLGIAGLRDTKTKPVKYAEQLEVIQQDIAQAIPQLGGLYSLDTVLEDSAGRRYLARLYMGGGIVHYVVLASPKNSLKGVLKKLTQQGWKVLLLVEKKTVKTPSPETDVR